MPPDILLRLWLGQSIDRAKRMADAARDDRDRTAEHIYRARQGAFEDALHQLNQLVAA